LLNYYTGVLQNYAGFQGRARRAEYWYFALANFIVYVVLNIIGLAIGFPYLGAIYGLAILIPSLAVGVRRLHDTDRSGWWLLIGIIPLVGAIVLIVFTVQEGTRGGNKYGPDPKYPGVDAATAYTTL
jgi:uncharacterized membrane protein YhaH (DUF805 family)